VLRVEISNLFVSDQNLNSDDDPRLVLESTSILSARRYNLRVDCVSFQIKLQILASLFSANVKRQGLAVEGKNHAGFIYSSRARLHSSCCRTLNVVDGNKFLGFSLSVDPERWASPA
jgi:hypothetical protein